MLFDFNQFIIIVLIYFIGRKIEMVYKEYDPLMSKPAKLKTSLAIPLHLPCHLVGPMYFLCYD